MYLNYHNKLFKCIIFSQYLLLQKKLSKIDYAIMIALK